ncbi:BgTH12-04162 [Blumeria graminis f. sp. triticale]|uniref:BgTH12-04162 n=1 Tax=Blumeria graminis f. sp. triticale TaxID=1689686 RepID=A0A9W4D163_BLUGR|nr:BgTH12-04162 [Blumeria graminis f. sp. triticale]
MFRGIYVGCENDKRATIAQQLAALLDDDVDDLPKWSKRELDQIIGYGVEFQSLVFNRGIQSVASATDNGDHDKSGFTNLKCNKADKGKNIPLKGERDKNINYIADQGYSSDDSDNESDSIRKKEPKGKKKKRKEAARGPIWTMTLGRHTSRIGQKEQLLKVPVFRER